MYVQFFLAKNSPFFGGCEFILTPHANAEKPGNAIGKSKTGICNPAAQSNIQYFICL
jgi:hypothetical protein